MRKSITNTTGKKETAKKKLSSRTGKAKSPGFKDSPVNKILFLQRTIGNKAVQRLLTSCPLKLSSPKKCPFGGACDTCPAKPVQTKLTINKPGDRYEQEADQVADQVMRMQNPECLQCNDEETISTKPLSVQITPLVQRAGELEEEEEEPMQAKQADGQVPEAGPGLTNRINTIKSGGQPLDDSIRTYFEPRFSANLSNVRVHTGSDAAQTARMVNAKAFTLGRNIVFGQGQYSPQTTTGRKLMAHELTHVIQQTGTH